MRLPPKKISTSFLETQMDLSVVHIGCERFWSEICGGKTCTPPQANTQRKIHSHNRMGGGKIHWLYTRLGLQAKKISSFITRLHQEGYQLVQSETT